MKKVYEVDIDVPIWARIRIGTTTDYKSYLRLVKEAKKMLNNRIGGSIIINIIYI